MVEVGEEGEEAEEVPTVEAGAEWPGENCLKTSRSVDPPPTLHSPSLHSPAILS